MSRFLWMAALYLLTMSQAALARQEPSPSPEPAGRVVLLQDSPVQVKTQEAAPEALRSLFQYQQPGEALRRYTVQHPTNSAEWLVNWSPDHDGVGATLVMVDGSLRSQLDLPKDSGLVVASLVPNGAAAKAGLQPNDILLTLAETPLHAPGDVILQLKKANARAGHAEDPISLKLLRAGKTITIKVKPEVRVTLGAVAVAEEKPSYFLGLPTTPVDGTLRAQLSILPEGTGLIVGEVVEGSPAAKAGIKQNDILIVFAGEPLPNQDALRARIQATEGKPTKITVVRAGKKVELSATPEIRKEAAELQVQINGAQTLFRAGGVTKPAFTSYFVPNQVRLSEPLTTNPLSPGDASLAKKIEELNAKIAELAKSVEELKKAKSDESK